MAKRKTTKEKNEELAKQGKQLNHFGIVLRIYPNEAQEDLIKQTFGCSRLIYNKYLAERQDYYKKTGKTLSVSDYKINYLNPMKQTKEYSFLKTIDKFALEAAVENVNDAYQRFFSGQNKFPKFKSKHKSKKSYKTKFTNNNIEIKDNQLKLPKLKFVEFKLPKGKHMSDNLKKLINKKASIKTVTVSEKAGKYYASLACEEIINLVEPLDINSIDTNQIIGIDLGLIDFATITNGTKETKVPNPKYLRESEEKIAKLQRSLDKKKKGSKNHAKAKKKLAKAHEKVANQRKDFAHQLSRKLVNESQVIVVEDLNIKGMVKNKKLAKSISDAGWYRFITYLDYKLALEGKHLVKIDRWFASSKICSACGDKNIMLTLNEREWICSSCGTHLDRDENAAINIRNEGIRLLSLTA